jgi:potassium efflux system protein
MLKRRTPPRVRSFAWLCAVALLQLASVAAAQTPSGLTVELVDQRIAALRASGTPSDNTTLTTYEQVRGFLNDAGSYAREAATYVEALTSAPQREAEIQRRLDAEAEAYDPATELEGLTTDALRARLAEANAAQRDLQSRRDTLDRRLAGRDTSAAAIPARLAEIQQRLDALPEGSLALDPAASPSLAEANQWRGAAETTALENERRAREAELASQPARFSAITAERAEIALQLEQRAVLIREIDARLSDAAQTVAAPAALTIPPTDPAYGVGVALAARVTELGSALGTVNQRLAGVRAQNDEIARGSRALDERFATARRIVEYGSSDALGTALLRYRAELESYVLNDPTERLPREMGAAIIRNINYEETLERLVSASGFVNQQLRDAGLQPESIAANTRAALVELVPAYRDRLRAAMTAESDYIAALGTLDTNYLALTARLEEYQRFLEDRILWIPNRPPLWEAVEPGALRAAIRQFVGTIAAIRIGPAWTSLLAVLAVLTLVVYRRRLMAVQQASNAAVGRPNEDSIGHSLRALAAAAARAAPLPILLLGLAAAIDASVLEGRALRVLVYEVAFILFTFSLMRIVSEPEGIGRVHFRWRPATMDRVHAQLTFLNRAWLPVAFATALITRLAPFAEGATLARPLMVVAMLMLTLYFAGEQVREVRQAGGLWFTSTRHRLRALLVLVFLGLTVAVVYGQTFSVRVVTSCLVSSAYIGIFLLLAHALLMRSLRLARSRVRLKELETGGAAQPVPTEGSATVQEPVVDVGHVSAATAQLVNVAALFVAAAAALYIWEPLLPALAAFDRVVLWTSTAAVDGEAVVTRITLATVIKVLALAGLTLFAARRLPAVIEIVLRSRTDVSAGARYATSALLNYVIVGIGIVAALSALGLHWDQLQWLVAALGVGIGFGLQEIVANFISGIIILFERPIRVGDIVTIGDRDGTVTKIRIRATTIRDWDGKELLVPNREFITGKLLNWTLSDTQIRIVVNVGVAYGSDVEQALKILNDVVRAHPRTLKEPSPLIVFENFGENALELSARCFVDSPDQRISVMTELRMTINRALTEAGITIAFPQRDVHVDTSGPIRVAIEAPAAEGRARPEPLTKSVREA